MKKILSLTLASIMCIPLILSGCSSSTQTTPSAPAPATSSAPTESTQQKVLPAYPTKGIEIIVAVSAGGTPDVLTRLAADWLSKHWGVPVTVNNQPGGGAIPGLLEAMSAPPDGYIACTVTSQNTSQQHGANTTPPVDVNKLTYVARVFDVDLAMTLNANSDFKDVKSFNEWALKNPDDLIWANTGVASTASFSTAEWYTSIGGDISKTRMLTTSGGADSATQLASGNCVMNFGDFGSSASMVEAGKIKYLATSAKERNPYFPDTPTLEENGVTDLSVKMWVGFTMPNGTPDHIVEAWNDAIQKMINDDAFKQSLANVKGRTAYMNPTDFKQLVMNECTVYTDLATSLNIRK